MLDPVTPLFLAGLSAIIEILAVIAFALSGLAAALRVGMDFVGVCFVSGVSAFGGGTLRDLLLDRPFFWMEQEHLLWLVIILCFVASIFIRRSHAELM